MFDAWIFFGIYYEKKVMHKGKKGDFITIGHCKPITASSQKQYACFPKSENMSPEMLKEHALNMLNL